MGISEYCRCVVDEDTSPVVICDLRHTIVYMNPAAVARYSRRGGRGLIGKSVLDCHSERSRDTICEVLQWFCASRDRNRAFMYRNERDGCDVYMVALRDGAGAIVGYYEKHESRVPESMPTWSNRDKK